MNIVLEILQDLWEMDLRAKGGIRVNAFGIPKDVVSYFTLKNTLSRLKRHRLVRNKTGSWFITKKGCDYLKEKSNNLKIFSSPFKESSEKILLILFDIPEAKRAERDWFRWHLRKFGYTMIQKSVWVGPSPLPNEFVSYIKDVKLDKCIKSFKLAKPYREK